MSASPILICDVVESARGSEHYSLLAFGLVGALKSDAVNIRVIR